MRNGVLIAVACLSILAFFMPNVVITVPVLGKIRVSMYDVVSAFWGSETQPENDGRLALPDAIVKMMEMPASFKTTEAGVGVQVCAVAVLGIMLHYLLTIVWCVCWFVPQRSDKLWLVGAIQFPVLLTIGSSIVLASMKREMAMDNDGNFGAAIGTTLINSVSIEAGLIMWVLFLVALCGLLMPTRQHDEENGDG